MAEEDHLFWPSDFHSWIVLKGSMIRGEGHALVAIILQIAVELTQNVAGKWYSLLIRCVTTCSLPL